MEVCLRNLTKNLSILTDAAECATDSYQTDSNILYASLEDYQTPHLLNIILVTYLSFVSVFGVFGNILTILAIVKYPALKSIPNVFIANLAVCDLLICAFNTPITIMGYLGSIPGLLCELAGFFMFVLFLSTKLDLTIVAINRYILVCKPRDFYEKMYSKRNIILNILFSWAVPFLICCIPFVGLGSYGFNLAIRTCLFGHDKRSYLHVGIFGSLMVFSPSLMITSYCYLKIYKKFKTSQKKIQALSNNSVGNSVQPSTLDTDVTVHSLQSDSEIGSGTKGTSSKETSKKGLNVAKKLFVVWISFMGLWSPLVVVYMIDYYRRVTPLYFVCSFSLATTNSALNTVIYAVMNNNFREAYARILKGKI